MLSSCLLKVRLLFFRLVSSPDNRMESDKVLLFFLGLLVVAATCRTRNQQTNINVHCHNPQYNAPRRSLAFRYGDDFNYQLSVFRASTGCLFPVDFVCLVGW